MEHWIERIVNDLYEMDVGKHTIAMEHLYQIRPYRIHDVFMKCDRKRWWIRLETMWMADDHDHSERYLIPYQKIK